MKLTSHGMRIAQPWFEICPHCGKNTLDLYIEYTSQDGQSELYFGEASIACPWDSCQGLIAFKDRNWANLVPGEGLPVVWRLRSKLDSLDPERREIFEGFLKQHPGFLGERKWHYGDSMD